MLTNKLFFIVIKMIKKLETLAVEAFRKCQKRELYWSSFCLFSNIFIQMNHIEIYYLCINYSKEDECCLDNERTNYCNQCKRLRKFNLFFKKSFKLVFFVDKLIDILFEYKYHLLPVLKQRHCSLDHKTLLNHINIT